MSRHCCSSTTTASIIKGWGEGTFKVAHGLRIDREDNIWTTDNALHVIRKFSPDGKLLLTLGEEGKGGAMRQALPLAG